MTEPDPTQTPGKRRRRWLAALVIAGLAVSGVALLRGPVMAQMAGHGHGHGAGGHMGGGHMEGGHGPFGAHHGADGTGHDEVNMPGLQGLNATPEESAELAVMFRNFQLITREVTNLPDGIRTVTNATDDEVMAALVSHVSGMIGRIEAGDDPQIFIQSPTLDIFFERGDRIVTDIEVTEEGIVVTQTSTDPELVEALQTHAGEVSAMADRGMQAVHEMMMQRAGN